MLWRQLGEQRPSCHSWMCHHHEGASHPATFPSHFETLTPPPHTHTSCCWGLASMWLAYIKWFTIKSFTPVFQVECEIADGLQVYRKPLVYSSFTGSAAFPNELELTVNSCIVCVCMRVLSSQGSLLVCSELCSRNIPHPTKTPTQHNISAVLNIKWQAALTSDVVSALKRTGNFR